MTRGRCVALDLLLIQGMKKSAGVLALVLSLLGGATAKARAQEAPGLLPPMTAPAAEGYTIESKWYGYQVLLIDAGAWAVTFRGLLHEQPKVALGALWLGGPLVHILNGQPRRALSSGALRVGLTVAGYMIGDNIGSESGNEDAFTPRMWGGVIGLGAAQIIDWMMLSRKQVRRRQGAWFTPTASVTPAGVHVGMAGQF